MTLEEVHQLDCKCAECAELVAEYRCMFCGCRNCFWVCTTGRAATDVEAIRAIPPCRCDDCKAEFPDLEEDE